MASDAQTPTATKLASKGGSEYQIYHGAQASISEIKNAELLRHYFNEVTGVELPLSQELTPKYWSMILRLTPGTESLTKGSEISNFKITTEARNIILSASTAKGLASATYYFIETVLGCRKWAPGQPAECPKRRSIELELPFSYSSESPFLYKEVYGMPTTDTEYLNWHHLNTLNHEWLLWGHSFDKLVPPSLFKTHPEYFAFYEGHRVPNQLCLSEEKVFELSRDKITSLLEFNPKATYISVSPNDTMGHCQCERCARVNKEEGGPQGPLIRFVNRLAKQFPKYKFGTLAYGEYSHAPLKTRPRENVVILVSTIQAYRNQPIETEPSAHNLRAQLAQWLSLAPEVWVWDYYAQFTNYLAPFPDLHTIGPNIEYYKRIGIKGVFAQMAEEHYSDLSELKAYLLAKKLQDPSVDTKALTQVFLTGYYGPYAPIVKNYLLTLESSLKTSSKPLGIYGNPTEALDSYLSNSLIEPTLNDMDRALKKTVPIRYKKRLERLALSPLFLQLQQARSQGFAQNGLYFQTKENTFAIRPEIKRQVQLFFKYAKASEIHQLSERGFTLEQYEKEWKTLLKKPPRQNRAYGLRPSFSINWIADYMAKGENTLTDGLFGFTDYSYNWLLFDRTVELGLDLGESKSIEKISFRFLNDPRNWIHIPSQIEVWSSTDGVNFKPLKTRIQPLVSTPKNTPQIEGISIRNRRPFRYLKIRLVPQLELPLEKQSPHKKPILALDEIFLE